MRINKEINWIIRDKYHGNKNSLTDNDISRLKKEEPVDYIIGWKPFLNCHIDLFYKPLIPRPETEYWVEQFIDHINNKTFKHLNKKNIKILDIFAGSGCIGIAVLKNSKNSHLTFCEIDRGLAKQIKLNAMLNKINVKRFAVKTTNIFSSLQGKFDYILANPPYVPLSRKNFLKSICYEPRKAIFAKDNGLQYIDNFLKNAKCFLVRHGQIWLEHDYCQKNNIKKLLKKYKFYKFRFCRDQYGRDRFVIISKSD